MLKALYQVTLAGIAALIFVGWIAPTRATKEYYGIMVVTFDGNVFEAGAGRTCQHAWEHVIIPDDWREIRCEVVTR